MYTRHPVFSMRTFNVIIWFFCGAVLLCVLSIFQKLIINAPLLVIKGYLVPFIFGGTAGLILGLWYDKLRMFSRELDKANQELEICVERKTKDLAEALVCLQESEKKYKSIFDQSPIAIEWYDSKGVLIDINYACMVLFGIENPRELKEFNLFEDPNLPEEEKEKLRTGSGAAYQVQFDFTQVKKNNLYRTSHEGILWLDVTITPIGEPLSGYLVQIQDITERTRALIALKDSEARWKFALEGARDGVWDWNAVTDRVFYSNRWKGMLGYGEDEISDSLEEWESRIHPEDMPAVEKALEAHLQGNTAVYHNEHRVLCKDGDYKWILDRGKVIERTEAGKPRRVIGTHSDISDRKRWELEREKYIQELKEALSQIKTLSGLLPICSHCKKIRDDKGYWNQIESYIRDHSDAEFSHSICQECAKKYYPDFDIYGNEPSED